MGSAQVDNETPDWRYLLALKVYSIHCVSLAEWSSPLCLTLLLICIFWFFWKISKYSFGGFPPLGDSGGQHCLNSGADLLARLFLMDAALWFTRIHLQLQSVSFIPSLHISFACPWYLEKFIDFSIWRNGLNEKLATDWTSATNLSELSRNHSCSLSFLQKLSAAIDFDCTARNPYILLDCDRHNFWYWWWIRVM